MKCPECGDSIELHGPHGCARKRGGNWGYCDCNVTKEQLLSGNMPKTKDDTEDYARSAYVNGY